MRREFNSGARFGRLVVIGEAPPRRSDTGAARRQIEVQCDCGTTCIVYVSRLMRSQPSCGCANIPAVPHVNRIPEYQAWKNMIARCRNPKHKAWRDYGGRGISVCPEWVGYEGYPRFLACVGKKPHPKHSLDRIDVNGHYEPGNVRWTDWVTQLTNRRNVRLYEHDGKNQCLSAWGRDTGICHHTLRQRIQRRGWSLERAITEPITAALSHPGPKGVAEELAEGAH